LGCGRFALRTMAVRSRPAGASVLTATVTGMSTVLRISPRSRSARIPVVRRYRRTRIAMAP